MNAELNLQVPLGQGDRPMENRDRRPSHNSTANSTAKNTAHSAANTNATPAAVPISVYRELAAELQTTQAELHQLRSENQRLVEQNRRLRQEADRVVDLSQTLQKAAQRLALSPPGASVAPYSANTLADRPDLSLGQDIISGFDVTAASASGAAPAGGYDGGRSGLSGEGPGGAAAPVDRGVRAVLSRDRENSPADLDLDSADLDRGEFDSSGWWLVLTVILIVITAFGTGFLIVRPFLPSGGPDTVPEVTPSSTVTP